MMIKILKKFLREEIRNILRENWVTKVAFDDVFKNPSQAELRNIWFNQAANMLIDADQNLYVWSGETAMHKPVINNLGLSPQSDKVITLYAKEGGNLKLSPTPLEYPGWDWMRGNAEEIEKMVFGNPHLQRLWREDGFAFTLPATIGGLWQTFLYEPEYDYDAEEEMMD